MVKKFILLFFLIKVFPALTFGQIVTPALDQSITAETGIATSWRYFDSVGAIYGTATGTEKEAGVKVSDTSEVLSGGNAVLFFYMFGLELDTLLSRTNKKSDEITTDAQYTDQNVFLSYRLNEYLALAVESLTTDFTLDQKSELAKIKIDNKNAKTGFGVTVGIAKFIFLAYGSRNVRSTGTTKIDQNTLTNAENNWQETYYGAAFILGTPSSSQKFLEYKMGTFRVHPAFGSSQLRLEYAMITSPEKRKDGTGATGDNHHQKTERTLLTAEAKWGSFLFHYRGETMTESVLSFQETGTAEKKDAKTTIGLAFVQESSLTVGIYQTTEVAKSKIKSGSNVVDSTANSTKQMITLGITF